MISVLGRAVASSLPSTEPLPYEWAWVRAFGAPVFLAGHPRSAASALWAGARCRRSSWLPGHSCPEFSLWKRELWRDLKNVGALCLLGGTLGFAWAWGTGSPILLDIPTRLELPSCWFSADVDRTGSSSWHKCYRLCSYQNLVDSLEQMFPYLLFALGTISRDYMW